MDKKFFYVSSVPKSGQTILASLLHQNKDICFAPRSVVLQMMYDLAQIKTYSPVYLNFPAAKAFDYAVFKMFNNYYDEFTDAKYVLDRGPWGVPYNRNLLSFLEDKPKFIIIYRPILQSLAALMKVEKPNLNYSVYHRCRELMNPGGDVHFSLKSIKEIIKNKEDHIIIHYKDIVTDPIATVKKIYNYLGLKFKGVRTTNLDQYEVKGVKYYDKILDNTPHQNLHTFRKDKIHPNVEIDVEKYLPKDIIDLFKNSDVL